MVQKKRDTKRYDFILDTKSRTDTTDRWGLASEPRQKAMGLLTGLFWEMKIVPCLG